MFVLDTAAEVTVFDTVLQDSLQPTSQSARAVTADATSTIEMFRAPDFSVGKIHVEHLDLVTCMDLSGLRSVSGEPVDGILGMDVLQQFAISIDFDLGKVEMLSHVDEAAGQQVRVEYRNHRLPTIQAILPDGKSASFMVDTGFNSTGMLQTDRFDDLNQAGLISDVSVGRRQTLFGKTRHQIGTLSGLALAGSQPTSLTFDRGNYNAIGLGLLSRYQVTFDFPRRVAYLKRGLRFGSTDLRDLSGMHIVRDGDHVVIEQVDRGSAADHAGLQAGDILVTIDHRIASRQGLFSIREALCVPNPSVPVVFRSGGRIETTMLRLTRR